MFGFSRKLESIEEASQINNADRTKVLFWNKARDHSDMYDPGKELERFFDGYSISLLNNEPKPVAAE